MKWIVVRKYIERIDASSREMHVVCVRGEEKRDAVVSGDTWERLRDGDSVELSERGSR